MAADSESDMCWICLEEESPEDGSASLMAPCKCPRKVHPQCLARWQLQQAGRHEEKFCRFCNNELADWKHHLTPEELKPEVSKVQPIMVVYFEGQIHRIPVKQGPDGLCEFTGKIRELFRLPDDVDISLTFGCKEPMSGTHLKLEGMGAFDAAVHCASVAAAERQQKIKKSYSTGNMGAAAPALAGAPHGAGAGGGALGRAASNGSLPAAARHPHPAAGSPAAPAAADRRRRFQDGAEQQQQQQQQRGAGRSRSFTVGSSSPGRGAGGLEPPAAFRSILAMLGGGGGGGSGGSVAPAPAPAGGGASPFAAAAAQGGEQPAAGAGAGQQAGAHGGVSAGAAAAAASPRPKAAERLSLRSVSGLTDVPEADETLAVGTFGGKFRLSLKALSRRVARGLSFSNKAPGALAGGAAPGGGAFGSPAPSGASSRASSMPLLSPRVLDYGRGSPSPPPLAGGAMGSAGSSPSLLPPPSPIRA
ncbi:hypothetical protein HT031_003810 [Scenedesmus sp. PABB004]|nr:hypothetical protein HT031_003810 [Scenedesmus sp. PABB004]